MNASFLRCLATIRNALSRAAWVALTLSVIRTAPAISDRPRLANAQTELVFNDQTGQLMKLVDVPSGQNFIDPVPGAGGIWQIDLLPPSADGTVTPDEAAHFHWNRTAKLDAQIELVWKGFQSHGAPDLCVTVTVSFPEDAAEGRWRIAVRGLGALRPSAIRFPRVSHIRPQQGEVLAVPAWMGEKTTRARELLCTSPEPQRREWHYPGLLSMQCLALYGSDGPGLYWACEDPAVVAKRFAVFGVPGQRLGIEVIQLPENGSEQRDHYEAPYPTLIGTFQGDWFTAAERYRKWALEQPWTLQSRLRSGTVPNWVLSTAAWVWNRGRSEGVLMPAIALQERLGLPVNVFWHWWHGCAYDIGFPEYLPPREGVESFRNALHNAHQSDVRAVVYMNQRLWGMTTRSWAEEGAEQYAVKGPDGKVQPEVYNTFTKAPCASMCMGTAFWRAKYAGLAEKAVKTLGVDGIYMDQACSSLACYDASHGHPLGGGTYWMSGFRMLQADIRNRCEGVQDVALAGEGCSEAWLPYLDLMLCLQVSIERYARPGTWEPIPLFHAVYHGVGVFYGNYSSLAMPPYDELWPAEFAPKEPFKLLNRKFSQQFRLEQARAFVWGQQPTIANLRPEQFDQRAAELEYMMRLARLRYQAFKYLLYGTMLRPPALSVPEDVIPFSRLSIYAGQQEPLKEYGKPCPAILASAWQAPDGDTALVAANVTDKSQSCTVRLSKEIYRIPNACKLFILDSSSRRPAKLTENNGVVELQIDLEAADARIYEFTRDRTGS